MDFTSGSIKSEHSEHSEEVGFLTKLLRDALDSFNVQSLLRYGETSGAAALRRQIASLLIGKTNSKFIKSNKVLLGGKAISENDVLIFSSSQQALNAIFEAVLSPHSSQQKKKVFIQDPGISFTILSLISRLFWESPSHKKI